MDRTRYMLIILIVSAGLLFITFYPGAMSIDSYEQLRQARSGQFGDWHPPFMAWVWRAFDAILQGSILMLLAQLGLYLFSLWAIARVALPGPDSVRLGFVIASLWLAPVSGIIGVVWKDIWTSCLLLLTGACCLAITTATGRAWHLRCLGAAALAFTAALLFRPNAVFAGVPLLAYLLWMTRPAPRTVRWGVSVLFVGAAASALLLLVSSGLNRVLTVHHQHPLQSILIFDIAGVSTLSGRADFLNDASESIPDVMRQQRSVELSALQAAYYPSTWTPLVFETDSPLAITDSAIQVEHLAAIWSGAVTAEPSIYLEHRARVFREVIGATAAPLFAPVYFGIPRDSPDYQQVAQLFPTIELVELSPVQALLRSAFEQSARSIFYRPYFWLLLNVALVITAIISGARSAGLVAIGSSGLMYELALFFLAPSADYRYSHWLVLSTWVLAFGLGSQFLQKRDQPQ